MKRFHSILLHTLLLVAYFFSANAALQAQPKTKKKNERLIQELVQVKTDSPKDTMRTFMSAMNDYRKGMINGNPELRERIQAAIRCLDLHDTPYLLRQEKGTAAAIFLKEVIDRVILINYDLIPETPENDRWRLRNTEIIIIKVKEGERSGEWLFSPDTIFRARTFYEKAKKYSYLDGSGQGAGYKPPILSRMIPVWSKRVVLGSYLWQWLGILVAIVCGIIIRFLFGLITKLFTILTSKTETDWDDRVAEAVSAPLGYVVAVGFWFFCLKFLLLEGVLLKFLNLVLQVQISGFLVWMFYRLTNVLADFLEVRYRDADSHFRSHLLPLILRAVKVLVVVLGVLVTLQNMGYNVLSLLAGLGIGGLAFALAAKDTAANLFGSLMILFDKPFKAGDWIVLGSYEGVVEEIGLRSTRIRTFYDSVVSIPNSDMANTRIDNMGLRTYRRILTRIGVEYGTTQTQIEDFIAGIKEILTKDPEIRQESFHVNFVSYGSSSLEIMLYCFLKVPGYAQELAGKQRIYLAIMGLAEKLNISFAFPTQTLHLHTQNNMTEELQQIEKELNSGTSETKN
ncbi:MAG: mechanosensitive ion channel family protein [Spirochaetota bacterium]